MAMTLRMVLRLILPARLTSQVQLPRRIFRQPIQPAGVLGAGDVGNGIAVDSAGHAYVGGVTGAYDFPTTPNAYQTFNLGINAVFVAKLIRSFSISGHVLTQSGTPIVGATVTLNGAQLSSTTTEGDGSFIFPRLEEGRSFTLSA